MSYIFNHYDTNKLPSKIKGIRKLRREQYKKYMSTDKEEQYSKFACCNTQKELASKIGVTRQTLIAWEEGERIPSIDNLICLCEVCDCSLDYLLGSVDTPEIEPISKASHYSGISTDIIRYGIEHPDYLDCLNYFMHPKHCSNLFNSITLSAWKKFWIDSILVEIKSPLKEDIIRFYDEYNAITPFNDIKKSTYKSFLEAKLPREKLILTSEKNPKGIKIKKCFSPNIYQNFYKDREFNYNSFIKYLVDYTFEPLSRNALIELQKAKLANTFVNLFTQYLEEL